MSYVDLWGRTFKLKGISSAKALGQEHEEPRQPCARPSLTSGTRSLMEWPGSVLALAVYWIPWLTEALGPVESPAD